jgi:sugar lactone lactonase YvrE
VRKVWPLAVLAMSTWGCTSDVGSDPCGPEGAPGTVCPIAGNGDEGFNGDGLPASQTAFYLPSQVRRGPDGLVYVMDFNNHRLRRIEANGTITTIAGDGFHAGAVEGVPAPESPLENPIDFDFLPDGRIVFVSYHDPRVLLVDHDGTLRVLAGASDAGDRGNEGDGGPPLFARFMELHGIAVAPDGAIYLADTLANRIRVIRGGVDGRIDTIAGIGGTGGYTGDGGPALAAELHDPSALALDGSGNLFFTDSINCVVRKIAGDGTISTVAGTGPEGELSHPEGIAVSADGTLYVGDRFHSIIRRVAADGTLTTIAGTGTRGSAGDRGPALEAQFGYIARIQIDRDGGMLIADQTNATVRRLVGPL